MRGIEAAIPADLGDSGPDERFQALIRYILAREEHDPYPTFTVGGDGLEQVEQIIVPTHPSAATDDRERDPGVHRPIPFSAIYQSM
jgi:hypothetical protein